MVPLLNKDSEIEKRFRGQLIWISSVVLAELYFGARRSGRIAQNLANVEALIAGFILVSCDKGTAEQFAQIKQSLAVKGRPIPENDIWIAATAIQHNLTLVTRDTHFNQVDGLTIEVW